jgi:hypothetical protein
LIAREPACIGFGDDDRILIGQQALTQNRTFFNLNRFLSSDDISAETFKKQTKYLPFDHIRTKNNSYLIEIDELQSVSPEYLLAKILKKMIVQLPDSIGKHDLEAVMAVSSNLSSSRINSLMNVFKLSNIKLNKLMSNIEAISLAHFYTMKYSTRYYDEKLALVYDLGSDMFEISLMHISSHDMGIINYELHSSLIDHNLGSIDFEDRIIEFCIKEFYSETQISLRKNKRALILIRQAAIKAFYELVETRSQVRIKIEKILVKPDIDLDTTLTYKHFQIVCKDLFRGLRGLERSLFEVTRFEKIDVDEVILVGQASSLLIEPSQSKVERIDLIDKIVLGVTLEAAFNTGLFESKKNFVWLNWTRGETKAERKSKKKAFDDVPYNLAPSYFLYTFYVILAAVLGSCIVMLGFLQVLGWDHPKAPPSNTNEAQSETLNTGNSLNNYVQPPFSRDVVQIQGPSVPNRVDQMESEASYTENIHYLTGVPNGWNNWLSLYNVKEEDFILKNKNSGIRLFWYQWVVISYI